MSMVVEVSETVYTLEIETAIAEQSNILDIEVSSNQILEISSDYIGSVVFANDIVGLDAYIANFIDDYEIDCGTP